MPCIPLYLLCTHVYPSNTVYPVTKKSAKLSASAATATIVVRIPKNCHAGVEKAGLKDGKQVKPLA